MFFKSIRWRLQLWYGVILVAVLIGFGFTAYQLERNRRLRDIDAELQHRLEVLSRALHLQGQGEEPMNQRFARRPPPPDDPRGEGPPEEDFPPGSPPRNGFKLPPQTAGFFGGNE